MCPWTSWSFTKTPTFSILFAWFVSPSAPLIYQKNTWYLEIFQIHTVFFSHHLVHPDYCAPNRVVPTLGDVQAFGEKKTDQVCWRLEGRVSLLSLPLVGVVVVVVVVWGIRGFPKYPIDPSMSFASCWGPKHPCGKYRFKPFLQGGANRWSLGHKTLSNNVKAYRTIWYTLLDAEISNPPHTTLHFGGVTIPDICRNSTRTFLFASSLTVDS